jgi:predicted MPP superfamily phosphohydrolase
MKIASMSFRPHYFVDLCVGTVAVLTIAAFWYFARSIENPKLRLWARLGLLLLAVTIMAGVATSPVRIGRLLPPGLAQWMKGFGLLAAAWVFYAVPVFAILQGSSKRMPERRRFLRTAAGAAIVFPTVLTTAAFVRRNDLEFHEFDIKIAGLPKDLQGLRIVQLSDIHLSAFVSEAFLQRAIAMANGTKAHIALVTGDLISSTGDPLDTCIRRLQELRSDAGTFGCLGNHEIYADSEAYTVAEAAKRGMRFLRSESELLTFGNAKLNLSGVDYQRRGKPYLPGAEKLILPGVPNILLSHNPDVFPVSEAQGFDLTISGHTHGGQVNFEILEHDVNIARFFTPYIYGRYERGGRSLFVTRGIGTVGAPARLGAPPEVALIRLCAS